MNGNLQSLAPLDLIQGSVSRKRRIKDPRVKPEEGKEARKGDRYVWRS